MKKQTLILVLTLLFNISLAQQKETPSLAPQFDGLLSAQFKPNEPGATVLIARKGEVIYKKAFGMANLELNSPMQVDNVFRIGSITKQFTAIAILQLVEQGKLSLQDQITKFIPDYPTHGSKITIEHLLTHTSGIKSYTDIKDTTGRETRDFTPAQMIEYFKHQPLRFAPGTKWEYSNSGYFLLGYIIEQVTGKTYGEYIEDQFFRPLGMTGSQYGTDTKIVKDRAYGYTRDENGFANAAYISMTQPYAAGSLQSTIADLFKWQQAVLSGRLVRKEALAQAFKRYKLTDGQETNYGYGWRMGYIQESPSLWHGGLINGFFTMAMYLPKEDVFVAVLSNCDCNSPADITTKLAALAIGKPYEYKEVIMTPATLGEYSGVFENEKGRQRIVTVSGDKLYVQFGRGQKSVLRAYKKDSFFLDEDALLTMAFRRNPHGSVEQLKIHNRVSNEIWNKTDKPIPSEDGIKLADDILDTYVGVYEMSPQFTMSITREQHKLFIQASGQGKLEMFAETENKFFLKVNDAEFEFIKDESGLVTKVIFSQGSRTAEAKRIIE